MWHESVSNAIRVLVCYEALFLVTMLAFAMYQYKRVHFPPLFKNLATLFIAFTATCLYICGIIITEPISLSTILGGVILLFADVAMLNICQFFYRARFS